MAHVLVREAGMAGRADRMPDCTLVDRRLERIHTDRALQNVPLDAAADRRRHRVRRQMPLMMIPFPLLSAVAALPTAHSDIRSFTAVQAAY